MMDQKQLQEWVSEHAGALGLPGAAVGVRHQGAEHYAVHGVTSTENPLPVDEHTLFCFGSTGKTFTATAVMRLVEQGRVALDDPVRTYVPELKLKDPEAAEKVTVMHLLNHTAGWSGDAFGDFGDGDDALAHFVGSMERLEQVTPLGSTFSYNNAAYDLAGHVIARVTGQTYEAAIKELLHDPLKLEHTLFFPNEVMTHRFAAGHRQEAEGKLVVYRKWAMTRASAPSGGFGVSACVRDQVAWARFHLGDGTAPDGTRLMSKESLDRMKQPTFEIAGSALGDAVGISWFLRDVDGVRLVSHGGDVLGQHSAFVMVPEADFAVTVLTNCDGLGSQFNEEAVRWALEAYLGVVDRDPEPVTLDDEALAAYAGRYETIAVWVDIAPSGGGLEARVEIKPETLAELSRQGEEVPEQPIPLGLLPDSQDRYVVTGGEAKGMKGYFVREPDGTISGVHIGGRLATRVKEAVAAS
jgi:CubicO group peptidase (beta-lactamase class C family)